MPLAHLPDVVPLLVTCGLTLVLCALTTALVVVVRRRPGLVRAWRDDRGSGTVENVGILTVCALLLVAVLLAFPVLDPESRARQLACVIANAFTGGGETCGTPSPGERSPEDYVPPEQCVYQADGAGWQGSVAVGVQVDGGGSWLIEELGDESFRLTRMADGGVGAEVGAGFDVSWRDGYERWGLAANIGGTVIATGSEAEVYVARDRAEAERILGAKGTADVKSGVVGEDNVVRDLVDRLFSPSDEELLEPVERVYASGIEARASAGALVAVAPAEAGVVGGQYDGWVERADGTRTDVWNVASDGGAMAAYPTAQDRYDPELRDNYTVGMSAYSGSAAFEVDRDADGEPVAIRYVTTSMTVADNAEITGEELEKPEYTETRVQMPIESAADRALAARIADGLGIWVEGINDGSRGLSTPDKTFGLGTSFERMREQAKARGHYWIQDYTQVTTVDRGGTVDAKLLFEAGLSGGYYETERVGTGYRYWNGQHFVSRSGCS